jgi:hypothetical protein
MFQGIVYLTLQRKMLLFLECMSSPLAEEADDFYDGEPVGDSDRYKKSKDSTRDTPRPPTATPTSPADRTPTASPRSAGAVPGAPGATTKSAAAASMSYKDIVHRSLDSLKETHIGQATLKQIARISRELARRQIISSKGSPTDDAIVDGIKNY